MKRSTTRSFGAAFLTVGLVGILAGIATVNVRAAAATARPTLKSAIALDAVNETITLPLHKGVTATGKTTWFIVIDSSSKADATSRGVNFAPRLANVLGTKAVQKVSVSGGVTRFAGTVDFAPKRVVVPSKTGFPPAKAVPGAIGDKNYSPLITADGHVVLDAPQVANATGKSDSVTNLDVADAQAVALRAAAMQALGLVFVNEEIAVHVVEWDVVLGVLRPLPHIERSRCVEDNSSVQQRANAPRGRLDEVSRGDALGIVAHGVCPFRRVQSGVERGWES